MSETIRLKDADGNVHWTARGSQAAEQLLRDGAEDLDTPEPTEVTDAAPSGQGDDHDTGTTSGGSRKRQRTTGTTDHGDGSTGTV